MIDNIRRKGTIGNEEMIQLICNLCNQFSYLISHLQNSVLGWSGGAMVLGNFPVPGRPTIWMIVRQGPIALAIGAGGDCLDIFTLLYPFSPLSPSLWETARYRLKYCLIGPLNQKQPTNQNSVCKIEGAFAVIDTNDHSVSCSYLLMLRLCFEK